MGFYFSWQSLVKKCGEDDTTFFYKLRLFVAFGFKSQPSKSVLIPSTEIKSQQVTTRLFSQIKEFIVLIILESEKKSVPGL